MKIEIEISEQEITDAISRKVRVAIADQTNQWGADEYIRQCVKKHWHEVADAMVKEHLSNSESMKEKIILSIENKLKSQINKLMRCDKAK